MVIMIFKMNYVLFLCCTIVCYGSAENVGISVTETPDICKGDSCSHDDQRSEKTITYESSSLDVNSSSLLDLTENLSEKDVYFMAAPGQPSRDSKSSNMQEIEQESENDKKLQVFLEPTENVNSTHTTEELFNATDVTEVSKFPGIDDMSSTAEPDATITILTSTTKLNLPTTQTPLSSFLLQNIKKGKNICFCDIKLNQCDINCCCDEDCTSYHFKVFTKCDDNNVMYNTKYCYNTNFIFGNNTSHELIQSNDGLFCIVRENLKVGMHYKVKEAFTTLEAFNKSLPNKMYTFSYKSVKKPEFTNKDYLAGSLVWTFQSRELTPFKISHSSVGILCNSQVNIKYLIDEVKSCFYQQRPKMQCGGIKVGEVFHHLRSILVISNPVNLNQSQLVNSSKICKTNACIGITSYLCQSIEDKPDCIKIPENSKEISDISCWNSLSRIQYQIWHNGSEGITKMEAYLWVRRLPEITGEFLSQLITEVKYTWVSSAKKTFERSGNPGYITGKPVLAGRKIQNSVNGTIDKKEAIELSLDPKGWLSVLGSEKGICSSEDRIPVNFRENGQYVCSLKLNKNNFSKEKCVELQNNIFKLLVGNDVINESKENYFNKFVGTYGNSRVEDTGDWVQVLIDSFPIISSQAYFKSNYYHLTCKNIITDLYVDVVYSNTGSFLAPQAKILGVSFQFGKHKDLTYYCDTPGCENTTQYFKLSSAVTFVDVTKPATDAFAEPLSLEVKLPHDFFYPFFSKGVRSQFLNKYILILFFLIFL